MALHALDEVLDVVDVAQPLPPADPVEFAVELAETWHAVHHDEGSLVGAALVLAWQLEKEPLELKKHRKVNGII